MKLAVFGAILLLLAPAAGATTLCVVGACVDAWSAKTASCVGAGSERNVVAARFDHALLGHADAEAETMCVTAAQQTYRGWKLDAEAAGVQVYFLLANSQGACTLTAYTNLGAQRTVGCASALPPATPALLP